MREETGVTISVGVSFNKVFAKLGSDYKKPDATTVISRENFRELLWPLPVDRMIFVGDSSKAALEKLRVRTIGDLARLDRELLEKSSASKGLPYLFMPTAWIKARCAPFMKNGR